MKDVSKMTELELRDAEVPWPKTEKELLTYIKKLADRKHDYGTCVYAMSMAATAAFNFMASKLGCTGFQASCADLDILRRTRGMERFSIVNYENLIYPQYCDDEHFPNWRGLIEKNKQYLADRARALLAEGKAHPEVIRHWEHLASLSPAAH